MAITVRRSKKSDKNAIMELAEGQADSIHLAKKRPRLEKAIGSPELLVAEENGAVIGFMYIYFKMEGQYESVGADELHISALCIAPSYTEHGVDHGVGAALIGAITNKTDKPITADVPSTDFARMSILTNQGFTIVSHTPDKVTMKYNG